MEIRSLRGMAYLALAGGVDGDPVLGSNSTDTLSGLGPTPVARGTVLPSQARPRVQRAAHGLGDGPARLQVSPGPHAHLIDGAFDALVARDWIIDRRWHRTGIRCLGQPLPHAVESLESVPVLDGSVQLPPDGHPIVLGPDHGTTGGYPIIAVVAPESRAVPYRRGPGDTLTFTADTLPAQPTRRWDFAAL